MEKLKQAALAKMRPDTMVDADAPWQQRKSAETRERILRATIECLVERGYAGLSTNEITTRARVSRGALHHHFPTKMDMVGAAIEYIFYTRIENFLDDYASALLTRRHVNTTLAGVDLHWSSVQTPEYIAYIELAVAARTDAELNRHFLPAAQRFDRAWREEMQRSFPGWVERWDAMEAASDFAMAAHLGLLLHRPIFGDPKREQSVHRAIAIAVAALHAGETGGGDTGRVEEGAATGR